MYKALILIAFGLTLNLNAQNSSELVPIKDLKTNWLTVNSEGKNYVPFINGGSLIYPVIGIILNRTESAGLMLQTCLPEGTAVFVDNKIVDRTASEGCRLYNVDSLLSELNQESVFISFFKDNLNPDLVSTMLMTRQTVDNLGVQSKVLQQIKKRSEDHFGDFFIVAIIFIAGFYAFLRNRYPKGYKDFFNYSKAFSLTFKEEKVLTQRNMAKVNALFLWLYSMIISLVIILFWKIFGGVPDIFEFVVLDTFLSCLTTWFIFSLLANAVIWLKYLLIKTLCTILNAEKIAQIHFFDFVRMSMIFTTTTLVVLTVSYLSFLNQIVPFILILYLFVILLGARVIILLLKLIGDTSFRKILLISYLCTTEILPLLIGIRIFF